MGIHTRPGCLISLVQLQGALAPTNGSSRKLVTGSRYIPKELCILPERNARQIIAFCHFSDLHIFRSRDFCKNGWLFNIKNRTRGW